MSYTRINGMRSARYPLQGTAGCGCQHGVGSNSGDEGPSPILGVAAIGLMAAGLMWYMGRGAMKPNRRRR